MKTTKTKRKRLVFDEYHYKGCCYGTQDGPDDFVKECDCGIDYFQKVYIPTHKQSMDQLKKLMAKEN